MQRMFALSIRSLSRRAITGVLALWLCVVAAGVWAPMARAHTAAQGMELLCSGHGAPQWVHSPFAPSAQGDAAALHHLIDCPLCLPVLAPPNKAESRASQTLAPQTPAFHAQALHPRIVGRWPPPRGPPASRPTLE